MQTNFGSPPRKRGILLQVPRLLGGLVLNNPGWCLALSQSRYEMNGLKLFQKIADCFPTKPLPPETAITQCSYLGCPDCSDIEAFFNGKQWDQVSVKDYRLHCDATSLTTQTAFNYFLPGWMSACVLDRKVADVLPEYLISVLGGKSDFSLERSHACYGLLSLKQLECAGHFFEWYIGGSDGEEDSQNASTRVQHWIAAEKARCECYVDRPIRRLRIRTIHDLQSLSIARLQAYRKKALSLESKTVDWDAIPADDDCFVWFKDDPRWKTVYLAILSALNSKHG